MVIYDMETLQGTCTTGGQMRSGQLLNKACIWSNALKSYYKIIKVTAKLIITNFKCNFPIIMNSYGNYFHVTET